MKEIDVGNTLSDDAIQVWKDEIDGMSQYELAELQRFAPVGHPVFDRPNGELHGYYAARFKELGGMTPAISKALG